MNQGVETQPNHRGTLQLTLPEAIISSAQPWADEVLDRRQVAAKALSVWRRCSSLLQCPISIVGATPMEDSHSRPSALRQNSRFQPTTAAT